jgi:hypothetical protein
MSGSSLRQDKTTVKQKNKQNQYLRTFLKSKAEAGFHLMAILSAFHWLSRFPGIVLNCAHAAGH